MATLHLVKPPYTSSRAGNDFWQMLGEPAAAEAIERAVRQVIDDGLRTGDIFSEGTRRVGTREMGEAIAAAL